MRIDNLNRAQQAYDLIRNLGLYVHDSPSLDLMQLISNCKKFYKMHGSTMGIIVLDYIQLMPAVSTDKGINRTQEIADISRSLKSLARELSVPVVAISQLNRNVDERIDKRPTLSDLRESGALEQDADVVIFIYRDEIYNKYSTEKNLAEIIIGKHRNGPIGKILTSFNPSYSCFSNYNENEKIEELYLEDVLI
jgi:replicative DNA helicase